MTAALVEPFGDHLHPTSTARRDGDGWRLDGSRTNVPAGMVADIALVPAAVDGGATVFIVDLASNGVTRHRQTTTSGVPEALLTFTGVRVDRSAVLGDGAGESVLRSMVDHATVASAASMAGLAAEAVRLIGTYTSSRSQFGHPIAEFQAVTQRAAGAYVDAQAVRLTMLQAAWRLGAGLPADREVAVAKYWAAAAGQRVVHAAMHLHGGIGVDRDYPLHRYFLLAKQLELYLGGATRQLLALGAVLAAEGPTR
jgi:alkylation response protein AidB-like acyl-CoA dehydrogenase